MSARVYSVKAHVIHVCEHCGKEIPLAEKCYIKTFKNKGHEPHNCTTYTGRTITYKKSPSIITHMSIGLCTACMNEAEELVAAWIAASSSERIAREDGVTDEPQSR